MTILQSDYNTQRDHLRIAEYGRHIQEYVAHIQSIADKETRTQWVHNLVNIMGALNPEIKLGNVGFFNGFNVSTKMDVGYKIHDRFTLGGGGKLFFDLIRKDYK